MVKYDFELEPQPYWDLLPSSGLTSVYNKHVVVVSKEMGHHKHGTELRTYVYHTETSYPVVA